MTPAKTASRSGSSALSSELKRRVEQAKFLATASEILSSSLDYETTLKSIAQLMVPRLAEWCSVEILQEDGSIRQLALAHHDPKMVRYALELNRKYPANYDEPQGIGQIIRTGKPELIEDITDEMLVAGTKDEEHLQIARNLRLGSYMGVPLTARGHTLGAIVFCTVQGKRYTKEDLSFAMTLAARAAMAVDNARIFAEKDHFAAIIASSNDAIIGKSLDGVITSWNAGAQYLYGYTAGEIVGQPVTVLSPPELHDEIPTLLRRLKQGSGISGYETRRRKKSGDTMHVSLTFSPIKNASGTVIGASAIERDITELVEARQELRSSREELRSVNAELEKKVIERTDELRTALEQDRANLRRLRTMLGHLPMGALMMNERGHIIELNEQYCRLFNIGLSAADAMAIPSQELNTLFQRSLLDPAEHMKDVMTIIAEGKTVLGRDIHLKDGRVVQRDFLVIHDKSTFRGQLFLYRDVTHERRIDATKSEFMSLASHQLRTPLTAIRWSFGRLEKNLAGKVGPLEEQILRDGRVSAARMSQTINTMLQISRIQSGQVEPSRSSLSLRLFLETIREESKEESEAKHQNFTIECDDELVLHVDEQLLQEVMTNLVSNAIKYTPENGSIFLSARPAKNKIEIQVRDSGYGIPAHQQEKVFHKFFRGDNVISKDPDGTGLGLYLVSLIAGLLGGDIGFESVEGRGTTFRLLLPRG